LQVCLEYRNPVGVISKGALIRRDVDLLGALARAASASVALSIGFADDALARKIEPWASPPSRRFEALAALADAGVNIGISLAPIIPGLNDEQIPELLTRAKQAGARWTFMTLLRLPGSVLPVFEQRLREAVPLRAGKVLHAIEDMRAGQRNDARFGSRMRGQGPRWAAIEAVFELHRRRLGLLDSITEIAEPRSTFRRPRAQRELFE
jgi:DNA repair photolyase